MQASQSTVARRDADARDWVAWYEELGEPERIELRGRLLTASYDEVKADAELRHFFFFHSDDLVAEMPPGSERLAEVHSVLQRLRGATDAEAAETRRKAVAFLLGEYQRYVRDNPWLA